VHVQELLAGTRPPSGYRTIKAGAGGGYHAEAAEAEEWQENCLTVADEEVMVEK
jgi:hypothetical protein